MIVIEIDSVRTKFDEFYDGGTIPNCGALYGCDEVTRKEDKVRSYKPTKPLWALAAYRHNEDGSIFGIQGFFMKGEWAKDENGELLYRVWDRII